VGVGHLGKHHVRLLADHPAADLVGIADTDAETLAAVAGEHSVRGYADFRELPDRVEAVTVAVPTRLHREVAGFFLERGVHVLVEKPITRVVSEGRELVDLAAANDRILQVGHVERFNPGLRAIAATGMKPRYIEAHRLAPFSFRSTDIGVVLDLMIHDLELVLGMIRSPIASVDAFGGAVFTPAEDMASAILKFEDGAVAHLTASRIALRPMRKMRIFSRDGYASLDFNTSRGTVIRKNPGWDLRSLDVEAVDTNREDLWQYVFGGLLSVDEYKLDEGNPLLDELTSFLDAVAHGKTPVVTGEAGLAAVAAAERVVAAIDGNRW
jgi:predicted dehydrogenase